jgi:hypothetical protein
MADEIHGHGGEGRAGPVHAGQAHAGQAHGGQAHGTPINDVALHERTFEAFIHFWAYVFGAAALVLIFLAIFNS